MNRARARSALLLLVLATMLLGACRRERVREPPVRAATPAPVPAVVPRAGPAPSHERDGAPEAPPDVSGVPEPEVIAEPRAAYGNHSPYTVLGRTYRVLPSSRGYVERGIASWYGTKFHGRATSSREPYDMYKMTAAHKTLPLPTYVRVTHLENGRSVVVRVNDRGPFHAGRIIDLSYAAAVKLGVDRTGTAPVEVRALDAGEVPPRLAAVVGGGAATPAAAPVAPAPAADSPVYLQIGAFDDRDNARRVRQRLREADIDDVFLDRVVRGGRVLHRVRVGPLDAADVVTSLQARLAALGFRAIVIAAD